jgi:probable rRNA maturation factor
VTIDIHVESAWPGGDVPDDESFVRWASAALARFRGTGEIAIRIVDRDEGAAFNEHYRHRRTATNVLSFPAELPPDIDLPLIGDLVICGAVVVAEAHAQGKPVEAHWAHLTVHGVLHLIGFDHQTDAEAREMEGLETATLIDLGYADPYDSRWC